LHLGQLQSRKGINDLDDTFRNLVPTDAVQKNL